jgi:hypothetical protein
METVLLLYNLTERDYMNKHYADTIINFSYTLNNKTQVANVVVNYNFESLTQKNKDFLLKQLNKKYGNVHINSFSKNL